jgi:hypothetical protein
VLLLNSIGTILTTTSRSGSLLIGRDWSGRCIGIGNSRGSSDNGWLSTLNRDGCGSTIEIAVWYEIY